MRTEIQIALALGFVGAMAIGAPIPAKAQQGCPCGSYYDDVNDRPWSERRHRHRHYHEDDVNDRPWSERSSSWIRRHSPQYSRGYDDVNDRPWAERYGHRHRHHRDYDAYDAYYYVEDYSYRGPWYYRSYYYKGNGFSPVYKVQNRAYDIR